VHNPRPKSREWSSTIEPPVFIHPEIGAHLIDVLATSQAAEPKCSLSNPETFTKSDL
jgi:hypothetical protein